MNAIDNAKSITRILERIETLSQALDFYAECVTQKEDFTEYHNGICNSYKCIAANLRDVLSGSEAIPLLSFSTARRYEEMKRKESEAA